MVQAVQNRPVDLGLIRRSPPLYHFLETTGIKWFRYKQRFFYKELISEMLYHDE
jgi:hypothetical protein